MVIMNVGEGLRIFQGNAFHAALREKAELRYVAKWIEKLKTLPPEELPEEDKSSKRATSKPYKQRAP